MSTGRTLWVVTCCPGRGEGNVPLEFSVYLKKLALNNFRSDTVLVRNISQSINPTYGLETYYGDGWTPSLKGQRTPSPEQNFQPQVPGRDSLRGSTKWAVTPVSKIYPSGGASQCRLSHWRALRKLWMFRSSVTNKPASSVLRSEIKHAASDVGTKEVCGSRFSPFLECSRHLLSALFLSGARLKLVYLFYNIELENFLNKTSVFISRHVSYLIQMKK